MTLCKCTHNKHTHSNSDNTGVCMIASCRCAQFRVKDEEPMVYPMLVVPIRKTVKKVKSYPSNRGLGWCGEGYS